MKGFRSRGNRYSRCFDDLNFALGLVAAAQRQPEEAHGLAGLLTLVDWLDCQDSGFLGSK